MILISLSGKKHSGKTTVAELMSAYSNHNCELAGWADALKDEVCKAMGITRLQLETHKEQYRLILQGWGTDFRRKQDPNYWIKQLAEKINTSEKALFIVHDTRFCNELQFIKDVGGFLIRVVRPGEKSNDAHSSETELDDSTFERTIVNDGSLEQLNEKVIKLMKEIKL